MVCWQYVKWNSQMLYNVMSCLSFNFDNLLFQPTVYNKRNLKKNNQIWNRSIVISMFPLIAFQFLYKLIYVF